MMYTLLEVLSKMNSEFSAHCDINPTNIEFINKKNIRVSDQFNELRDPLSSQMSLILSHSHCYASPELYNQVQAGRQNIDVDYYKLDSFGLGMVLLECGIGDRIQKCYKYSEKRFDIEELESCLSQFRENYPENTTLVTSVERLLMVDPEKRVMPSTLLSELPAKTEIKP